MFDREHRSDKINAKKKKKKNSVDLVNPEWRINHTEIKVILLLATRVEYLRSDSDYHLDHCLEYSRICVTWKRFTYI